jgi:hypothetical protein
MKAWRNHLIILTVMLLTMLAVTACGKKKTTAGSATPAPAPITPSNVPPPSPGPSGEIRICSLVIENLSVNALEAYMFRSIENMRGPATACLKFYGTGKYFDAAIRIEYEDDFGVRSYNMVKDYTIFSEIKDGKLRILWLDSSGFVELKGTKLANGKYRTTVRFSNLPQQNGIQVQSNVFNDVYTACKNGTYTVNQCANWSQPVYYPDWNLNNGYYTEAQMLKLADEYLAGQHGSEAYTLGRIQDFNLSSVVVQ